LLTAFFVLKIVYSKIIVCCYKFRRVKVLVCCIRFGTCLLHLVDIVMVSVLWKICDSVLILLITIHLHLFVIILPLLSKLIRILIDTLIVYYSICHILYFLSLVRLLLLNRRVSVLACLWAQSRSCFQITITGWILIASLLKLVIYYTKIILRID